MGASMYDKYKDEITKRLDSGYTMAEIFRELFTGKGFVETSFRYYCRMNGLVNNEKYGMASERKCDDCENCGVIKPFFTGNNRIDIHYCKLKNQQINPNIKSSPRWCPIEN